MAKKIYSISAEAAARRGGIRYPSSIWHMSFSRHAIVNRCKGKKIFRLPNGLYICSKKRIITRGRKR